MTSKSTCKLIALIAILASAIPGVSSSAAVTSLPGLAAHGPTDTSVPSRLGVNAGASWNDWNLYRFDPSANTTVQKLMNTTYTQCFKAGTTSASRRIVYRPGGSYQAYIDGVDNTTAWPQTALSEGMGYGMMFAVQMNDSDTFAKLWSFAQSCMQNTNRRYFYGPTHLCDWKVSIDQYGGVGASGSAAPDGDEWIATALLLAGERWSNAGYISEAKLIINDFLNPDVPYYNSFSWGMYYTNPSGQTVTMPPVGWGVYGAPNTEISMVGGFLSNSTDASYHLPAFYGAWKYYAMDLGLSSDDLNQVNALIYRDRYYYLPNATGTYFGSNGAIVNALGNHGTGLAPIASQPDGELTTSATEYSYDAWRVPANIALDYCWWGDNRAPGQSSPWQFTYGGINSSFFGNKLGSGLTGNYRQVCYIDGTNDPNVTYGRGIGQVGMNAVGALIAPGSVASRLGADLINHNVVKQYYADCLFMRGLVESTGHMRYDGW